MVQDLEAVSEALCGGNPDFVWTESKLDMAVIRILKLAIGSE